jgi:hypothetical protein
MTTQIAVLLGKALLNWLKRHPGTVDAFAAELAERIPGGVDDTVVKFLAAFFRNLI